MGPPGYRQAPRRAARSLVRGCRYRQAVPEPTTLLLFTAAAMALIVVPGPAVLYIVGQSVDGGRRAGLVSALGIATGGLVHVLAAAIGLSAFVLSSATAFSVVKYAGAAYLVVLGIRRLLERDEARVELRERGLRRIYGQGVVVNVLNPKTALFFFAFLPQFVDVASRPRDGAARDLRAACSSCSRSSATASGR